MSPDSMRRTAARTFAIYAVYGISVEGVIGTSVLKVCRTSEGLANYRQIRLSTSVTSDRLASRCSPPSTTRTSRWFWPISAR
jgi:hypothetical protein